MLTRTGSRGADALVQALAHAGVTRIFALSGNHVMPVFDALVGAKIGLVHTRHEAAAVHMADAWARLTGEPGIALVTGGPGHANAVSALYTAQMAESPVVLLSGHAPGAQLGKGAFQEMRQAEMAAPVVKAAWTSKGPDALAGDLARALATALGGRPGPVNLNLPSDALEGKSAVPAKPPAAQPARLEKSMVLEALARAERPLVLAGPVFGTRRGRAKLAALEEACGVPALCMESPRGMADPALGAFAEAVARADCVLLLCKRLDFTLKFGAALHPEAAVLQVDPEAAEIERSRRALGARLRTAALADPFPAVDALIEARSAVRPKPGWLAEVRDAAAFRPKEWRSAKAGRRGCLHPVELARPLQALLDSHPDSVLVVDGGEIGQWAQACLSAPQRVVNGVAGAIGAALPFALGARCAVPEAPIVAVMGDGTAGFHLPEIDTAVTYKLPFVAVIGNDARWNAEYQIQLREYGAERAHGCELRALDYARIAQAFGAFGEKVTSARTMAGAVRRATASKLPAVLDVKIEGLPAPQIKR